MLNTTPGLYYYHRLRDLCHTVTRDMCHTVTRDTDFIITTITVPWYLHSSHDHYRGSGSSSFFTIHIRSRSFYRDSGILYVIKITRPCYLSSVVSIINRTVSTTLQFAYDIRISQQSGYNDITKNKKFKTMV